MRRGKCREVEKVQRTQLSKKKTFHFFFLLKTSNSSIFSIFFQCRKEREKLKVFGKSCDFICQQMKKALSRLSGNSSFFSKQSQLSTI
jgi:hypothetical protein